MVAWKSCYYSSAYSLLAKVSPLSRNRAIETLVTMPALLHQVLAFATLREAWYRVTSKPGLRGRGRGDAGAVRD